MATSSGGPDRFPYQPLTASRTIRLLKFLPGSTPKCQMIAVEVEKAPPYLALSYTWGSKRLERSIEVNGLDMPITRSLAEAIDAIYDFARSRVLMFWADSACINQDDVHERGRQVRLMSAIYRSAELVAVWLGPAADDSDFAFDQMSVWEKSFENLRVRCGGNEEVAIASIAEDPMFYTPPGSEQDRAVRALRGVFRRRWWKRAWVVQEGTAASPYKTFFSCGSQRLNWIYLRAALRIIGLLRYYKKQDISLYHDSSLPLNFDHFRREREGGVMIKLLNALRLIRVYECEDIRDKVYASLGMAMDVSEDDIVPDYTKSYQEVYLDVVRQCLSSRSMHSLDFLGYVLRPDPGSSFEFQPDHSLPTWVPDWNRRVSLWALEKDSDPKAFISYSLYNASGSRLEEHRIENNRLYLGGSVLRGISQVYRTAEWYIAEAGLAIQRSWMQAIPDSEYITGETSWEAFNHTLVADVSQRELEQTTKWTRGAAVDWDLLDKEDSHMTPSERAEPSWMLSDINITTYGRRLFQTSDGLIGLGPAACRPDDKVCLLFGGQVLHVLREHGHSEWEYMGECYVHGIMDGQGLEDKSFAPRDFVIV